MKLWQLTWAMPQREELEVCLKGPCIPIGRMQLRDGKWRVIREVTNGLVSYRNIFLKKDRQSPPIISINLHTHLLQKILSPNSYSIGGRASHANAADRQLARPSMSLSKLQEIVEEKKAWHAAAHGVTKSQTQLSG